LIERPRSIIILIILWLLLASIYIILAQYSATLVLDIPAWQFEGLHQDVVSMLFFGSLMSTITWFVFAGMFILFAYGTYKADNWIWTTGIIIITTFLAVFGLMITSFIITVWLLPTNFSTQGLSIIVILTFIDLGIIYQLTRPKIRLYFNVAGRKNSD
jgi:hypothetical protein